MVQKATKTILYSWRTTLRRGRKNGRIYRSGRDGARPSTHYCEFMIKRILLLFSCLLFLLSFSLKAAELTLRFSASRWQDDQGLRLLRPPAEPWDIQSTGELSFIRLSAGNDYFKRRGISFRLSADLPPGIKQVFLIVEHLDQNIGLSQVSFDADRPDAPQTPEFQPAYTPASAVAGFTCLGTGKPRTAVFRLDRPAFRHRQDQGADFRIEGIHALTRLTLQTASADKEIELARQQVPSRLAPRLQLSRPLQRVTTVGADARETSGLPDALAQMRELAPLAHLLGFNGFESYVKWNFVEPQQGRFDWSFYDRLVAEGAKYELQWFPLLIVGSAYTLPDWYYNSPENEGFVCLEHKISNPIQTIFCENQTPHVQRFLQAFGRHYEPGGRLLGIRLGPSGNYGESQYPAGGNWGYKWGKQHIHIGWWAGDKYAAPHFRSFLKRHYANIEALNKAWGESYPSFDQIETFIPQFAEVKRKRKDMTDWYMGAMTDWCERWALWARDSMPKTEIYQSAGGWGFVESGTDFTEQTRSMVRVRGGIRSTNETDSYAQNFYATRMLSSAARFYHVPLGAEPAGFGSARGVVNRIYNLLINNGQHLFFYHGNFLSNDQGVAKWLELAPLLDKREEPFIQVAALYPDTKSTLDDGVFRNLYAFSFNQRVAALRPHLDFDFCSERMIRDGALSRYKVLAFLWSDVVEKEVLEQIDLWVRQGGTVLYPYWGRMPLGTVEDDFSVYNRWLAGDTGKGKVTFYYGDREPPHRYADFLRQELLRRSDLDPRTMRMLQVQKPSEVYVSVLQSGTLAVLNYNDNAVTITIPGNPLPVKLKGYDIALIR